VISFSDFRVSPTRFSPCAVVESGSSLFQRPEAVAEAGAASGAIVDRSFVRAVNGVPLSFPGAGGELAMSDTQPLPQLEALSGLPACQPSRGGQSVHLDPFAFPRAL
jgi:hypothetical protein